MRTDRIYTLVFPPRKIYTCIIELLPKAVSRQNHSNPTLEAAIFPLYAVPRERSNPIPNSRCTIEISQPPTLSLSPTPLPIPPTPPGFYTPGYPQLNTPTAGVLPNHPQTLQTSGIYRPQRLPPHHHPH